MLVNCKVCNKEKDVRPAHIKIGWGKYCSRSCANKITKNAKGSIRSEEFKLKSILRNKQRIGKKHPRWKGEEAGYIPKHSWMKRTFGQPKFCESCATEEAKSYHWANISENYIRIREDWIRLCQSCHFIFDNVGYKSWETRRKKYGNSGRMVQGLY